MKAIAFIFVPIAHVPDFSERLADCVENIPDCTALVGPAQQQGKTADSCAFWTWFLPNPLGEPDHRQ
jgi:hypothetical protein